MTLASSPVLANETEVAKIKLASSNVIFIPFNQPAFEDWVRIEVRGREAKLLHTSQVLDQSWGIYHWHDHKMTRVVFTPDGCTDRSAEVKARLAALQVDFEAKRLEETVLLAQRKELLDELISTPEAGCSIIGQESLSIPAELDPHRGMWTIRYIESEQEKAAVFRLSADLLPNLAVSGEHKP